VTWLASSPAAIEYEAMTDAALQVLVIDENAARASIIEEGLREAGHRVVTVTDMRQLLAQIARIDPDVIFIDLENPNRDVLEQMFQVSRSVRRPVVMFVDQSDKASIEAAIDAGVSAYVVDGMRKERVKPILDMAISRFNAFHRLREELDRTKQALEHRKVIDRAKGILMKSRNISEEDAYALLRKTAMNESRRMADVARGLVTAAKLLG
jgi:response regulator NasT